MKKVSKQNVQDVTKFILQKLDRDLKKLEKTSKHQDSEIKIIKDNCRRAQREIKVLNNNKPSQVREFPINESITVELRKYMKDKFRVDTIQIEQDIAENDNFYQNDNYSNTLTFSDLNVSPRQNLNDDSDHLFLETMKLTTPPTKKPPHPDILAQQEEIETEEFQRIERGLIKANDQQQQQPSIDTIKKQYHSAKNLRLDIEDINQTEKKKLINQDTTPKTALIQTTKIPITSPLSPTQQTAPLTDRPRVQSPMSAKHEFARAKSPPSQPKVITPTNRLEQQQQQQQQQMQKFSQASQQVQQQMTKFQQLKLIQANKGNANAAVSSYSERQKKKKQVIAQQQTGMVTSPSKRKFQQQQPENIEVGNQSPQELNNSEDAKLETAQYKEMLSNRLQGILKASPKFGGDNPQKIIEIQKTALLNQQDELKYASNGQFD